MKLNHLLLAAAATIGLTGQAGAATLVEAFDEPFAEWETRWFGANSNAANYYVSEYGEPAGNRGANSDGLWLTDGDSYRDGGDQANINIRFEGAFAASLARFTIDIASLLGTPIQARLVIFDRDGAELLSEILPTSDHSPNWVPVTYTTFSVRSGNGIGGFDILGYAQGNVSVDNLVAQTSVPEPANWAMMIVGFGLVGARMRTRRHTLPVRLG